MQVDPFEEKKARWTSCKLSAEPLAPPCVADELGSLYNKNAIITALLNRSLPRCGICLTSPSKALVAVSARARLQSIALGFRSVLSSYKSAWLSAAPKKKLAIGMNGGSSLVKSQLRGKAKKANTF